ncbi:MAG: crosslink repair DNA glycosylase YcaQ family protein [Acidobacteriota bacterium]
MMSGRFDLDVRRGRRLALARAGLLRPERTGLPTRGSGRGHRARRAAHAIVERFGYLQLDSVSVVGARTHSLVLASRLEGFEGPLGERLLQPGEPLFEYWGHEASWIPIELYPTFAFRRAEFRVHPWWGDLLAKHRRLADQVLGRLRDEGPLRSLDLTDDHERKPWWGHGPTKKVVSALWSSGDLAVSERRGFQRTYDLTERVIPDALRVDQPAEKAIETLLLRALDGLGWSTTPTLSATWRLKGRRRQIDAILERLAERGDIARCRMVTKERTIDGWIRPRDRELAEALVDRRPRRDRGVLLSPFDPLLWDRARVLELFDFEQILEIYKPAKDRRYGYYCLPILAGEHLIGRVDLKAHRPARVSEVGWLEIRALHFESERPSAADRKAAASALRRHARVVGLGIDRELKRLDLDGPAD